MQQSEEDLRVVGSIYRIAGQGRTERILQPEGCRWVRQHLLDFKSLGHSTSKMRPLPFRALHCRSQPRQAAANGSDGIRHNSLRR
jgi:hypothetical protein